MMMILALVCTVSVCAWKLTVSAFPMRSSNRGERCFNLTAKNWPTGRDEYINALDEDMCLIVTCADPAQRVRILKRSSYNCYDMYDASAGGGGKLSAGVFDSTGPRAKVHYRHASVTHQHQASSSPSTSSSRHAGPMVSFQYGCINPGVISTESLGGGRRRAQQTPSWPCGPQDGSDSVCLIYNSAQLSKAAAHHDVCCSASQPVDACGVCGGDGHSCKDTLVTEHTLPNRNSAAAPVQQHNHNVGHAQKQPNTSSSTWSWPWHAKARSSSAPTVRPSQRTKRALSFGSAHS